MKTGVIKLDYSYNKIDLDNFIAIADRCVEDFEDGKPEIQYPLMKNQ